MLFNDQALFPSTAGLVRFALAGLRLSLSLYLSPSLSTGIFWNNEPVGGGQWGEKVHPKLIPSEHTIRLRDSGIA